MSRIALGIIRKPHGVRGEASVEPWTDSIDRLAEIERATLVSPDEKETRAVSIESTRVHSGRVLVKFVGIDSPEALRDVQNWTIEIPESEARKLAENEYFLHDLVGLELIDASGRTRGIVADAYEGGGGILLSVKNGAHEYEVPFAEEICTEIDLKSKRITVELPEGLEDLQSISAIEDDPGSGHDLQPAAEEGSAAAKSAAHRSIRIDFVTIFPRMIEPLLAEGVIARGIKQGLLDVRVWDLREFATDKHRSTDDEAYGGGPGMVMLAEPILRCVEAIRESDADRRSGAGETHALPPRIVMTTPQGRRFTQETARELAGAERVVFLCGRYEGFDQRVIDILQPDEISVGDFVVSGGELPAMLIADAVGRMIEGVVGNSGSVEEDSFFNGLLDYPHYTRPEELRGLRVPEILMSGHHENIRRWRREQALRTTLEKRADLLENAPIDDEAREMLAKIAPDSKWAKEVAETPKKRKRK